MFCMKCGKSLDEGVTVCPECGEPVDMQKVNEALANNNAVNTTVVYAPAKKGKGGLIAAIIAAVVVLAGAGFCIFWFNRPIYIVQKAIENNDTATVAERFDDLKDEEKEIVEEQMEAYIDGLYDSFKEEEIEFDYAMDELELLQNVVDTDEVENKVKTLNTSRENYAKAEKAFKDKDYENAVSLYSTVVKDDSNYRDSLIKIDECKEEIAKQVYGVWECNYDMGDFMIEQSGLTYDGDYSFCIPFRLQFNEDGTGRIFIDIDMLNSEVDKYLDFSADMALKQYSDESGYSVEEINDVFVQMYGMSFKEYMKEAASTFSISEYFEGIEMDYEYEFKDGVITLKNVDDSATDTLKYEDGIIYLDLEGTTEYYELQNMGLGTELAFVKQ